MHIGRQDTHTRGSTAHLDKITKNVLCLSFRHFLETKDHDIFLECLVVSSVKLIEENAMQNKL